MNHLLRELAPVSDPAWSQIEDEAKSRLTTYLAGRRLVDYGGPKGWDHSAYNLGRSAALAEGPGPDVSARVRRVLPLVELRASFELQRAELDDADRGSKTIDLSPLDEAAKKIALAENVAVFHGYPAGGIVGITAESPHPPIVVTGDYDHYPRFVAKAVETLMESGISGPFGLALGSDVWTAVVETAEHGGYPLFEHLKAVLGGPIVWAPGVDGGIVVSQRGGDYHLDAGQDLSIGYLDHTGTTVTLYLEESFTFQAVVPEAGIALGR